MCCPYSATIHSAIIQPLYILHYSGALFATIQILFVPPPFSYCTVYIPAPVSYCTYVHFSFFTFCQHSTTVQCAFRPNSNTIHFSIIQLLYTLSLFGYSTFHHYSTFVCTVSSLICNCIFCHNFNFPVLYIPHHSTTVHPPLLNFC